MLRLKNTLTRTLEEFKPLEENVVRIYACGPTVYDFGHIGNFRTFVAVDLLRRYLKYLGYRVYHVMNITDIEDKIIRDMRELERDITVKTYREVYNEAVSNKETMHSLFDLGYHLKHVDTIFHRVFGVAADNAPG